MRLRSYLVRERENDWPHGAQMRQETAHGGVSGDCRRICVIERDLLQLRMVLTHVQDDQEFDSMFADMVEYGFPVT